MFNLPQNASLCIEIRDAQIVIVTLPWGFDIQNPEPRLQSVALRGPNLPVAVQMCGVEEGMLGGLNSSPSKDPSSAVHGHASIDDPSTFLYKAMVCVCVCVCVRAILKRCSE